MIEVVADQNRVKEESQSNDHSKCGICYCQHRDDFDEEGGLSREGRVE